MFNRFTFNSTKCIRPASWSGVFLAAAIAYVYPCAKLQAQNSNSHGPARALVTTIDDPAIQISDSDLHNFDSAFHSVSLQARVTIIAEGMPLYPDTQDKQRTDLRLQLPVGQAVPASVAIAAIAASFDYDVERADNKTFLLRKRYSDPQDLPCVTYEEIVHCIRSVDHIMSAFDESTSATDARDFQLWNSLSPSEKHQALTGLAASALSVVQQQSLMESVKQLTIGGKHRLLDQLLSELILLKDRRTQAAWIDIQGFTSFGFEGPFGPGEVTWHMPFTNGFTTQVGRASILRPLKVSATGLPQDPALPTPLDRQWAGGMLANRLESTRTLAELSSTSGHLISPGIRVSVDEALAQKTFCLFGADNSSGPHLVRSVATMYGLVTLVPREGDYTIALPTPRVPTQVSDISIEIRRVIPLPLYRALASSLSSRSKALWEKEKSRLAAQPSYKGQDKIRSEQHAKNSILQRARLEAYNDYYLPAVRRFLLLAQPAVPTEHSPPAAIADLNPEVLRLLTIAGLTGLPCKELDDLAHLDSSADFNDPSKIYIQAGMGKRNFIFGFSDGKRSSTGELIYNNMRVIPIDSARGQ